MKKNSNTSFQLLVLITLMFFTIGANAQFAPTTTVAENSCATGGVSSKNTGNDILSYNGNQYMVTVTDDYSSTYGLNAGISMSINGGTPYHTSFTVQQNIIDPDVAFVEVKGNVYAVVTYFVDGRYYFIETFTVSGGSLISCGIASFGWSTNLGSFGKAVNIDTDSQGDFAIVYDNNASVLYAVTGSVSPTGTIALNWSSSPEIMLNNGTPPGFAPDVAMIEYLSVNYVDFTWVDSNTGSLQVEQTLLSNLSSGIGLLSPFLGFISPTPIAGSNYYYPRIACPNPANAMSNVDWTVVVEETNFSTSYKIDGFNCTGGGYNQIVYNDGSGNSPVDLTMFLNSKPVVCYDSIANNVWVGWNFDNSLGSFSGPAITNGLFPIVLTCDFSATILPGSMYLPVPRFLSSVDDDLLSMAGRNSSFNLYSFYSIRNSEDYYKAVSQTAPTLRQATPAINSLDSFINTAQNNIHKQDGNTFGTSRLVFYDLTGKEVLTIPIQTAQNPQFLQEFAVNHPSAIYLIRVINENGAVLYSEKVYISQ